ncbi:uncharacterized protein BX663DRAFT_511254 [Cokeromyces recurvatus]|uniref:uncharacterized protein n=1 Tax=Cokeromyces recurvatus TaxID=90255 RepID=UPI0022201DD8|nr:uncharacterized protein BX663DRAFT_511254 [Cokeromyces recurvatus]KAI7902497.1 hypothetical protein BX663DRAFT_511254 [Cokeromyces recurvatus]
MFPPYPQFSNRIYINPKFSNTGANPQQMMQQQQQQRQFMEMEAQRMIMLQQQMQMQHQQEKQRMAELDQKRRETAENIRKRKEAKEQLNGEKSKSQLGEKRDRNETDVEVNDRQSKRQETMTSSNEGGISIKGAASRVHHHSSLPPRNIPYTPPHYSQRRDEYISKNKEQHPYHSPPNRNDIRNRLNLSSENITSRLNKSTNSSNKNSPVSIVATPVVPISTNGKSNVVIIQGLSSNTKEEEIKKLTNSIPGGANEIKLDVNLKTATVIFPTVESAVTFRRKYNRIQMGDSHINITFQKIK